MNYLTDIERLTKPNMGGLVLLQVARVADILSIPTPSGGQIYGDIDFVTGKGFHTWYATDESMSMQSEDVNSMEGNYKQNRLPFLISKDRPEIKAMLDQAMQDSFIVKYMDANGSIKLFGTLEAPVQFGFAHTTNASRADINGYNCQFYYDGPDNVYYLNEDTPAPPPTGDTNVILRINGVVKAVAPAGSIIDVSTDFKVSDFKFNATVT